MGCVVARQPILLDRWLQTEAQASGGFVSAEDLSKEATELYMAYLLQASSSVAPSLVNYVYDTCGGNPFSVEVLSRQLESVGVLERCPDGRVELLPDSQLMQLPYPEDLKGMALASFEKLAESEQALLKTAAVLCQEDTDISATNEFSTVDLALYMGTSSVQEIESRCRHLVEGRIFVEVRTTRRSRIFSLARELETTARNFRFVSQLLQHVASTLVLEVQKRVILARAHTASMSLNCTSFVLSGPSSP